jgi:SAM-dependent methyltransferase
MDLDQLAALRTDAGARVLAAATDLAGPAGDGRAGERRAEPDPLRATTALRAAGHPADLVAAALTQAALRRHAVGKFGSDARAMFFTRAGLEQATRSSVAARRAARLRDCGVRHAADLCCGIGADTLAMARAGLRVTAVDADPLTATVAAANVAALGLNDRVEVRCADASTVDLSGVDAVFCDPARRTEGSGRRTFDPRAYSPSWDFVVGLAKTVPATVLKLGPGIDHGLIPADAEAEWVSVDGDLVEAALWFGPLAGVPRRATVLRGGSVNQLTGTGLEAARLGEVRRYLYDPDPAVIRAHLVAEFASTVEAELADPQIAYAYSRWATATPYARCFEITYRMPFSLKRLRAAMREQDIGVLEIRKRGSALEPEKLRRDLRLAGTGSATLVLTRVADEPTALICRPLPR